MNKDFKIKDAVLFEFSGHVVDLRRDCRLVGVRFWPGSAPRMSLDWASCDSNRRLQILFNHVDDFIVTGRDIEYPPDSGTTLEIAGFTNGKCVESDSEFYVEPNAEMTYMSFLMEDQSAILVRAENADMKWDYGDYEDGIL